MNIFNFSYGRFRFSIALICIIFFLFNFIAVFPGQMSPDSFKMFTIAVKWNFYDHHHPFISVLMALGRFIRDDPSPYLFFQLSLFWGGIYLFTLAFFHQFGKRSIVVPLIAFLPFNLVWYGYLHKTPLMSGCFLFALSWMFLSYSKKEKIRPLQISILLILLFLGAVIRGYSYLSALPLLGFLVFLFLGKKTSPKEIIAKVIMIPLLFTFVFVIVNNFLVYDVLKAKKTYKQQIIFKIDIAGICALTGDLYAIDFLKKKFRDKHIVTKKYNKKMEKDIWRVHTIFKNAPTAKDVDILKEEWLKAISAHFSAYLTHRKIVLLRTFGVTGKVSEFKRFSGKHRYNIYKLKKHESYFWNLFKYYNRSLHDSFLMKPWFWGLLNIAFSFLGLGMIFSQRYREYVIPHCTMVWSGFLLLAPYSIICLSADNRFTMWVTIATSLGGYGLVNTFFKEKELARIREKEL